MKNIRIASVLAVTLVAFAQGCALKPQNVELKPDVGYAGEASPSEILVGFSVADGRAAKKLGEVGDAHQRKVDVTVDKDFVPALSDRLAAGIEKRGFMVASDNPSVNRTLTVKVNNLTFNSSKTPLAFRTELEAEVVAVASTDSGLYERVYVVRTYQDTAGPPYEKQTTRLVNKAMSQALTAVMNDDKLFEMLTR